MAKQGGPVILEKTIGIVSCYKRCGVGCVRMKSNLTRERWQTDPLFAGSRKSAAHLAAASVLASKYYRVIPEQHRVVPHFRQLVGIAKEMLSAGFSLQQINKVLDYTVCRFIRKMEAANRRGKPVRSSFAAKSSLPPKPAFTRPVFAGLTIAQRPVLTALHLPDVVLPAIDKPPRGQPVETMPVKNRQLILFGTRTAAAAGFVMPRSEINIISCMN
ncbi:hypothetical protein [Filimonas effusa]|uniref:Uncharacterized protein n=1 Tax=Filimonas effusa TaxID=2508721 RepID=A0A4Q1DBQ6_9BACT|nr:hypothetical protein [Filimonas effusa]RXK86750.1 hypothetical protein ESB13_08095 [Filimonas effusa]